jgi:hypothetical protein
VKKVTRAKNPFLWKRRVLHCHLRKEEGEEDGHVKYVTYKDAIVVLSYSFLRSLFHTEVFHYNKPNFFPPKEAAGKI